MSTENDLNITIRVNKETGAIELVKNEVKDLDEKVDKAHGSIKEKFSQKFEHIALRSFISDGIQTVGLTREMGPLMSVMQMGIIGVAGAINIWAVALAAVAGIIYTVYNHLKKHNEELADTAKKQQDAIKTTEDLVESLDKYKQVTGKLPENLNQLREATIRLKAAQTTLSEEGEKELLEAANKRLGKMQEELPTLQEHVRMWERISAAESDNAQKTGYNNTQLEFFRTALNKANGEIEQAKQEIQTHVSNLIALHKGWADVTDQVKRGTEATRKDTDAKKAWAKQMEEDLKWGMDYYAAMEKASKALQAELDREKNAQQAYANEQKSLTGDLIESKMSEVDAWAEHQKNVESKTYTESIARIGQTEALQRSHAATLAQIDATAVAKKKAVLEQLVGVEHTAYGDMQKAALRAADTMAKGFSQSVAKTIVEGKSMGKMMTALGRQVEEQVIADLVEIGIKRTILATLEKTQSAAATAAQIKDITTLSAARSADAAAAKAASVSVVASLAAVGVAVDALTAKYLALAAAEKAALV